MTFISFLSALCISILVFFGYLLLAQRATRRQKLRGRMERLAENFSSDGEESVMLEREASGVAVALEGILSSFGFNIAKARETYQPKMWQAGLNAGNGLVYFLFIKWMLLPLLALLLALPLVGHFNDPSYSGFDKIFTMTEVGGLIFLGLRGANLLLDNLIERRKKKLSRSFPDTLDLMLVCVESGLALDSALNRVCRELGDVYAEITDELNRTRYELTLLNDRVQALQNLADRTDLLPFKSLVTALIQSEKLGTPLSDTLRVMSLDYRTMRLLDAENKANRLPALITIPMITMMLPAFFIVIIGPPIIRYIEKGGF